MGKHLEGKSLTTFSIPPPYLSMNLLIVPKKFEIGIQHRFQCQLAYPLAPTHANTGRVPMPNEIWTRAVRNLLKNCQPGSHGPATNLCFELLHKPNLHVACQHLPNPIPTPCQPTAPLRRIHDLANTGTFDDSSLYRDSCYSHQHSRSLETRIHKGSGAWGEVRCGTL